MTTRVSFLSVAPPDLLPADRGRDRRRRDLARGRGEPAVGQLGPLFHRWLQGSGPLTAEYADAVDESALDGLR